MRKTLPTPEGDIAFAPTLQLIEDIEAQFGSILKLADDLVQKNMPLSRVLDVLCAVYRDAGCDTPQNILTEYLWRGMGQSPVALLSDILLGILSPLQDMDMLADKGGATGEPQAAKPCKD